jgi:hypothetical protein
MTILTPSCLCALILDAKTQRLRRPTFNFEATDENDFVISRKMRFLLWMEYLITITLDVCYHLVTSGLAVIRCLS